MYPLDRRLIAVPLSVLALVAALSGCGGSGSSGSPTAVAGLTATDANEQPRSAIKDGGTIRWAIDEFPRQWNLNHLDGATIAAASVTGALMPGAFGTDEKAALTVVTDYVKSAKLTSTKPRQVITYKLNRKARWSDGKPLTWRDYAAQWKALRSLDGKFLIADNTGYDRVQSVDRGADDYEFTVTFKRPFAEWQSLFNPVYPEATNSDPAVFNKGWLNKIPVTAGPFKLGRIDKSAQTITIVRDPNWWGAPAKLDSIVLRALIADAAIGAFVNGEVDVVDLGTEASAYKRASAARGGVVRRAAGSDFRHLTINGASDILSDPLVRKAVARGISREALAKADLAGLDWPIKTMGNHFFVNTQTGYEDNSGDVGEYDPKAAEALLDQAGWKRSGEQRVKNGKTLDLRFVIPTGQKISKQEAELTQQMLAQIGVKVTIKNVPLDRFFDDYVLEGDFDLTPFSWFGTPFPISSAQAIYAKPVKDSKGALQVQQNFARIGSDEIDRLMTTADVTLDPAKARALMNQADKLIWDEIHALTLYQQPQLWGVNEKLANAGAFGLGGPTYEDVGFVK